MNLLEMAQLAERRHGANDNNAKSSGHKDHTGTSTAQKSKVKVFATIEDALKHGSMGQVFSTKGSKRLYTITKHKWGKSGQQTVSGRTAKGFTPGSATPGATMSDIKGYSDRTKERHAGRTGSDVKKAA